MVKRISEKDSKALLSHVKRKIYRFKSTRKYSIRKLIIKTGLNVSWKNDVQHK